VEGPLGGFFTWCRNYDYTLAIGELLVASSLVNLPESMCKKHLDNMP